MLNTQVPVTCSSRGHTTLCVPNCQVFPYSFNEVTNTRLVHRGNDYAAHWKMTGWLQRWWWRLTRVTLKHPRIDDQKFLFDLYETNTKTQILNIAILFFLHVNDNSKFYWYVFIAFHASGRHTQRSTKYPSPFTQCSWTTIRFHRDRSS